MTPSVSAAESVSAPSPGATERIIVVDDDVDILSELSEMLRLAKHDVVSASSAAEAKQRVLADPSIKIVISDLRMPDVDGIELIGGLQSDPALQSRPIRFIMVTGHGTLTEAQRSIRAHASDFLTKPLSPKALLAAIDRASASIRAEQERRSRLQSLEQNRESLRRQALDSAAKAVSLEAELAHLRPDRGEAGVSHPVRLRLMQLYSRLLNARTSDDAFKPIPRTANWGLSAARCWHLVARPNGLDLAMAGIDIALPQSLPHDTLLNAVEALAIHAALRGGTQVYLELGRNHDAAIARATINLGGGGGDVDRPLDQFAALLAAEHCARAAGGRLVVTDGPDGILVAELQGPSESIDADGRRAEPSP
jgi:CheY-like chemotaxis protein